MFHRRHEGFALPAAVVLSALLGMMAAVSISMTARSQESSASDYVGIQAYQVARAAAQYGVASSAASGTCWSGDLPNSFFPGASGIHATVSCSSSSSDEGGATMTFFDVRATACNASSCPVSVGGEGKEYVERQVRVVAVRCTAGNC